MLKHRLYRSRSRRSRRGPLVPLPRRSSQPCSQSTIRRRAAPASSKPSSTRRSFRSPGWGSAKHAGGGGRREEQQCRRGTSKELPALRTEGALSPAPEPRHQQCGTMQQDVQKTGEEATFCADAAELRVSGKVLPPQSGSGFAVHVQPLVFELPYFNSTMISSSEQ